MKKTLLLVLLLLLLSACLLMPPPPPNTSGQTLTAGVGQEFQIVLEADHTTPYRWELASLPSNLERVGSQYRPRLTKRAPRSGVEIWTFKALSVGEGTVSFRLVSQDSVQPAPNQSASFTVSVK